MKSRKHFSNMYVITTVSLSLVLILIGIECILLLGAHELTKNVKENVTLNIILKQDIDTTDITRLSRLLDNAHFTKSYRYITAEEALEDHIKNLGEDPTLYIENPLHASFEVRLNSQYAQADSIKQITEVVEVFPTVEGVLYPQYIVEAIDSNVNKYTIVIVAIALILLLIAVSLIMNTIRLQVYSKRFLINTMKLVGAKSWSIKGPIVKRNMLLGLIAAILAIAVLMGLLVYARHDMDIIILTLSPRNICIISSVIMISAIAITFISSLIAVNSYIRMKTNDLYFV